MVVAGMVAGVEVVGVGAVSVSDLEPGCCSAPRQLRITAAITGTDRTLTITDTVPLTLPMAAARMGTMAVGSGAVGCGTAMAIGSGDAFASATETPEAMRNRAPP